MIAGIQSSLELWRTLALGTAPRALFVWSAQNGTKLPTTLACRQSQSSLAKFSENASATWRQFLYCFYHVFHMTKLHKTRYYTVCTLQTCSPCQCCLIKPLSNPPASTTHPSLPAMQETWGGVSAACAQGGGYHSCQLELPKEGNLKCWKWSPNVRKSVPHHVQAQLLSTLKSSPERQFSSIWPLENLRVANKIGGSNHQKHMNNIHLWLCSSMHIYANLHLYSSTFILKSLRSPPRILRFFFFQAHFMMMGNLNCRFLCSVTWDPSLKFIQQTGEYGKYRTNIFSAWYNSLRNKKWYILI